MTFLNDFLQGVLPYQAVWLPAAIGVTAGMLCVFVGTRVARARRAAAEALTPKKQVQAISQAHDPFTHGSLTEQRRSLRRTGNPVEVLYARPENARSPDRGVVLDRSMGGLRLGVDKKIAPETRLVVLPVSGAGETPWIEVDVLHCVPVDDIWELHCQFVKTPQWSILLMFG